MEASKYKIKKQPVKHKKFLIIKKSLIGVIIISLINGFITSIPKGISIEGKPRSISNIEFIYDLTYEKNGKIVHEQNIFNKQLELIKDAKEFVIIDMFLFNDDYNRKYKFEDISKIMTNSLIEQKKKYPNLKILFITDEINNFYGAYESKFLKQLKENGIEVVITDSTKLRDSNPLYSGVWRTFFKWFGTSGNGWIANPFGTDSPKVTLRSYLKLLNLKANHRKVLITDKGAIVSSSNPHDASSNHSNIAFKVEGYIIEDLIKSELAVANFSRSDINTDFKYLSSSNKIISETDISLITEGKIRKHLINEIKKTNTKENITIGMFYLSDYSIIKELINAANRGVNVKLILDANKDAFGIKKNGIPNRPVASELMKKTNNKINIKWYETHGEQYHTKLTFIQKKNESIIIGGSANFTRRNIGDYNLETNIKIKTKNDNPTVLEVSKYFDRLWSNSYGQYTVDFSKYEEHNSIKYIIYRIQEFTGLCSF